MIPARGTALGRGTLRDYSDRVTCRVAPESPEVFTGDLADGSRTWYVRTCEQEDRARGGVDPLPLLASTAGHRSCTGVRECGGSPVSLDLIRSSISGRYEASSVSSI